MMNSRYNSVSKTIGTIDITPLMDLTFMLLIIFIITVPALEFTTEVNIPKKDTPDVVQEKSIELSMDADGFVKLNTRPVAMNALKEELEALFSQEPDLPVYISVDGKRPYEDVMELYRDAAKVGFKAYLKTVAE